MNLKMASRTIAFTILLTLFASLPKAQAASTWTKFAGNPVLDLGASGSWDDQSVWASAVLWKDGLYRMWYCGGRNDQNIRIGLATSPDGQSWTRYGSNPVLDVGPSAWDSLQVSCPSVLFNGSHYCMWYSGSGGSVGLATSSDGMSWTKHPWNPVFSGGRYPSVLFDGSIYKMWYEGYDYTIGYATSADGMTWTTYGGNPVLTHGLSGAWDGLYVSTPSVVFNGSEYIMSFGGYQTSIFSRRIGIAYSLDGTSWSKDAGNPVIDVGPSGSWDDTFVDHSELLFIGSSLKMWYSGFDGTQTVTSPTYYNRIGLATLQVQLTVVSLYDSPGPTSGSYASGTSLTASVTSPVAGSVGTQYVCTGWTGTGDVPTSGTGTTVTFTITQDSSITWNWKTQYYLTVKTDPTGVTTIPGQGWQDAPGPATLMAPPVVGKYYFLYWTVDGVVQGTHTNPINFAMTTAHTGIAHYTDMSVGGEWAPINVSELLTLCIGLASTMAIAASLVGVRRIKKRQN